MAITGCTDEYLTYSGSTETSDLGTAFTAHPIYLVEEYDESLSATTVVETIQCNSVKLGGNGYYS
jgi:hypothetical protein